MQINWQNCKRCEEKSVQKQQQKQNSDSHHGVRELPEFLIGSAVLVQDLKVLATVTE